MLAIIIKNSILFLLIIFIIHFIIKNHIEDVHMTSKYKHHNLKSCGSQDGIISNSVINTEFKSSENQNTLVVQPEVKKDETIKKKSECKNSLEKQHITGDLILNQDSNNLNDKQMKDLYDFVYNDESSNLDNLSKYFEEDETKVSTKHKCSQNDVICPDDSKKEENYCTNKIQEHHDQKKLKIKSMHEVEGILGTDTHKTSDGYQILFDYENDNMASIDNQLMGFETFESGFMTL